METYLKFFFSPFHRFRNKKKLGNDAARSFRSGYIVTNETEPQTIADGARTVSVGKRNWEILKRDLTDVIEVGDDVIKEALRTLFSLANLKSEPTGALSLGAVMTDAVRFRDKNVCVVVSGGNVDMTVYQTILEEKNAAANKKS